MGAPAVIAGLILLLAGSSWFTGAATVGWILLIVGGIFTVVPILLAAGVFALAASGSGARVPRSPARKRRR